MASLATTAAPHLCRRVRCRTALGSDDTGVAESFRFLLAQGAYTVCDRAAQWRLALATRFHPTRQTKGMDRWHEECVPIPAICPVHVSACGSDHSRFIPNVFRICRVLRESVFRPGTRHWSLAVLR